MKTVIQIFVEACYVYSEQLYRLIAILRCCTNLIILIEIMSINQEMESQTIELNKTNTEMKMIQQEIESLVAENKEIKETVLQMNGTLSMILDFCKFLSSVKLYFEF